MEHNLTIKTYMAIMAERDAAVRERNMALDERRRAFAERDMAMMQRDMAIAEQNNAVEDRDKALAALQYRESSMNENYISPDSPRDRIVHGTKHLYHQQQIHSTYHLAETPYDPSEFPPKPRRVKQAKEENKGTSTKKSKTPRKGKKRVEQDLGSHDEDLDGEFVVFKDGLGLNQVIFDESTMPVPVCSCTGAPQPCYKWGNGGWQSACCTTTISVYPLPQMSNKRHARVGGRKMSGSAFAKLLNRLASEGHDPYTPLDLKDHWAKHGTNRYSTLK